MAHWLCCSAVRGIFLDQGSNPCPLHWQQTLNHWASREVPERGLFPWLCGGTPPPQTPHSGQASQKPGKSASAASTPLLSVPPVKSRGDSRLPHAPSPGGGPGNSAHRSPLLGFADPAGCGSELPAQAGFQLKVPTQGSSRCWCQSPLPLPLPLTPDSHPDPIPRPPEEPWEPRGLLVQPPCAFAALAFRGPGLEGAAGREQPAWEESGAVPVSRGPLPPRGAPLSTPSQLTPHHPRKC